MNNNGEDKKGVIIAAIVFVIIAIVIGVASSSSGSSSKKSKWDSLSKEEKAWYEKSYGGGKSEAIDKAIKDYKKSKY